VFQELIADVPIYGIFIIFALAALLIYEVGYILGRWYQKRTPEENEGPTGMIVGSILALMAFMLAITMGMATDRYDTRRGLVMAEANAIGTTYLRAGYLQEPAASQSRALLAEYSSLRISPDDLEEAAVVVAESRVILNDLWSIAEELARTDPGSPMLALYIDALNETIDVENERAYAGISVRVPDTVLLLLFVGSVTSLGMVGLSAGLTGRRSLLTAAAMIVVLGAVMALIIDIDRPQNGSVTVSQEPIIQLSEQLNPPAP
jgi:MFS family permease